MRSAMSKPDQRALADTLRAVLNEAELADLRILIEAASQWADQLINHIAPSSEQFQDFDSAYSERDQALDIGNALNRFDAI
jgi:hypothetical protein